MALRLRALLTLHHDVDYDLPAMSTSLPPPPADAFQVITISSLSSALAKMHVDVSIEDIIKAVQDENEAQRAELTTCTEATERRAALSQRKYGQPPRANHCRHKFSTTNISVALKPNKPSAGLRMTTVSRFIPKSNKPTHVDPLAQERRRCLVELTQEAFPDGKVPDPFTPT